MQHKTIIWVLIIIILFSLLGVGVGYFFMENEQTPKKTTQVTEQSSVDEEHMVDELSQLMNEGYRPAEIEKYIDENGEDISDETLTQMVRELMKSMEVSSDYFAQLLYVMENELAYTLAVDEVENLYDNTDELTNEFAKGYLEEMKRNHVQLNRQETSLSIEPDTEYVVNKYGERLTGVYKEYIQLSASQQTDPIFDEEKEMYKPERLRDLIVEIDASRNRWEGTVYEEDFIDLEIQFYQTLFGVNQGTFFDEEIVNEGEEDETFTYTMKPEIIEIYESFILDNKDLELSKELKAYIDVLEENDREINEQVMDYLEDFFTSKYPELNEMPEAELEEDTHE